MRSDCVRVVCVRIIFADISVSEVTMIEKRQMLPVFKICELLLSSGCLLTHLIKTAGPPDGTDRDALFITTYGGYDIVCAGLILGHVISNSIPKEVDIFYSTVGCIMFLTTGGIALEDLQQQDVIVPENQDCEVCYFYIAIAKVVLSIVTALLFFADALITFEVWSEERISEPSTRHCPNCSCGNDSVRRTTILV